jgi:hypothetical protein
MSYISLTLPLGERRRDTPRPRFLRSQILVSNDTALLKAIRPEDYFGTIDGRSAPCRSVSPMTTSTAIIVSITAIAQRVRKLKRCEDHLLSVVSRFLSIFSGDLWANEATDGLRCDYITFTVYKAFWPI